MPIAVLPDTPHYALPLPTTYELDWAEIPIIDLSKASTPEGRAQLSTHVRDALTTSGFFYVVNHGYTSEQTARIFDIADVPFEQVSSGEKQAYTRNIKETGSYQGYKPRSYWHVNNGVMDQIENYNINRDVTKRRHPESLCPFMPEILAFARHNHFNVLYPILQLVARGLELPENTLADTHSFDADGANETYVRFMKYYPRSEDDENKSQNVWLKGHTDFGSITILWSQPVSALQILSPDGKWRWVKHIDNALIINAGDCLEFLSGGYYKATIHRVVQPPPDQRHRNRLGVFYFCIPDDKLRLDPLMNSPVLQRVGFNDRFNRHNIEPPVVEEWRKARTSAYGQSELKKGEQAGVEEEVIGGLVVKHYS